MNGMVMTMAAGGAESERRARRFTKEAIKLAGNKLVDKKRMINELGTYTSGTDKQRLTGIAKRSRSDGRIWLDTLHVKPLDP